MKARVFLFVFLFLGLIGCAMDEELGTKMEDVTDESSGEVVEEDTEGEALDSKLTVVASELKIPWSIEITEEVIYLSERFGSIVRIENGEQSRQDIELDQELSTAQEAGLLGFVLDPDFNENQEAIAYYTYEGNSGPTNRIVRLHLEDEIWTETDLLLDEIPSGPIHHGGRLAIGIDEKLYMTTGDAAEPELAQDPQSLAGNILRMALDGSIPEDNQSPDSYIFSYGHRNAQGLTWIEDGTIYASEHGNQANDEVNQIEGGYNYGWPIIEGTEEQDDLVTPIFTSGEGTTWAPSGMDASGSTLYVAALRGKAVLAFDLETNEERKVITGYGRIRDVHIANGFLYFITNNTDGRGEPLADDDQLYRVGLEEIE